MSSPAASTQPADASPRWQDRWFKDVKVAREAPDELAALARQGPVVFVMRSVGMLGFLFLAWLSRRHGLPPVRVGLGLSGPGPWLLRIRRSREALEAALARGESAVVFLAGGSDPDPFPALAAMQRRLARPILLVPALVVWSRRPRKLGLSLGDVLFGTPDAPNRLANAIAFLRNRHRAFLRLGRGTDVRALQDGRPGDDDATTGRVLRSALHLHLAREFRAAVGPPIKSADRVREQVLRDKGLRRALEKEAREGGKPIEALEAEARADLRELAARFSPGFIEVVRPFFRWFFRRTYDSVEVDEAGLERLKRAAAQAPLVLCPSHKSHIDYIIISLLLYDNGLNPPHIAAGINLSFWPFGHIARMGGAFFIRRTVKGDRIYTAVLRAYVKQLLRDRFPQEFFLEGGRSRTGKLLVPKTGLFSMEVDAWLDGAAEDVLFVPVAVDYEQLIEARSYARELAGGEKRKEDLGELWKARKVLGRKYGRMYLQFQEPVSLRDLARRRLGAEARGALAPDEVMVSPEARPAAGGDVAKRELVQALANRVAWGIAEALTTTPVGLLAAVLLSHARRGIPADEVAARVELLRRLAVEDGARLAAGLREAPADPRQPGALGEAMDRLVKDGTVQVVEAGGELVYVVPEERRPLLDFHRNAVLHRFVALSLVASALRASGPWAAQADVKERARFLSRLFKLEFMYRVGRSFDEIFDAQVDQLVRLQAACRERDGLSVGAERGTLQFFAALTRPYREAYRVLAGAVLAAFPGDEVSDRKALVRLALDRGRAAFLASRIANREALSKATMENAVEWLVQQGALADDGGALRLSPEWRSGLLTEHLAVLDLLLR